MDELSLVQLREGARAALHKLFSLSVEFTPQELAGLKAFCLIGGFLANLDAAEVGRLASLEDAEAMMETLKELADLSVDRRFRIVYGV